MPAILVYLLSGLAPFAEEAVKKLAPEALEVLEGELLKVLDHVKNAKQK